MCGFEKSRCLSVDHLLLHTRQPGGQNGRMLCGRDLSAFGPGAGGGGRFHVANDGAVLDSKKQVRLSGQSS